jgi:hypothetical protein
VLDKKPTMRKGTDEWPKVAARGRVVSSRGCPWFGYCSPRYETVTDCSSLPKASEARHSFANAESSPKVGGRSR